MSEEILAAVEKIADEENRTQHEEHGRYDEGGYGLSYMARLMALSYLKWLKRNTSANNYQYVTNRAYALFFFYLIEITNAC